MDGKDAIISRIIADANTKATAIITASNTAKEESISQAQNWAVEYTATQKQILSDECADIIARRKTLANLDVRKIKLKAKRDIITNVVNNITTKLCNLNKEQYLSLVYGLLEKNAESGDIVILSNNSPITAKDLQNLQIVKQLNLEISNDLGNFVGGVKLSNDVCDKDLSFATLIESDIDNIEKEIVKELFNSENV